MAHSSKADIAADLVLVLCTIVPFVCCNY